MKKAMKKALAALLAALMLLGVGGVAGAEEIVALPEETGEVTAAAFPDGFDKDEAVELVLGEPVKASTFVGTGVKGIWFKFTPTESRGYYFASHTSSKSSFEHTRGKLFDENGSNLQDSQRRRSSYTELFVLYQELEAGKTYYLYYTFDEFGREKYTLTVKVSGILVAPKTKVTIKYGARISWASVLKGTTWDLSDLVILHVGEGKRSYHWRRIDNYRVTAPDGEWIEIEVKERFSIWQWIKYYILFDWFFLDPDKFLKGALSFGDPGDDYLGAFLFISIFFIPLMINAIANLTLDDLLYPLRKP